MNRFWSARIDNTRITKSQIIMAIVFLLALIWPVAFSNQYFIGVMVFVGIYAVLSLGLNVAMGWAGVVLLGYAGFYAVGAYTTALLITKAGVNFWLTVPVSALLGGIAGFLLGLPTLKLKPIYVALVSLAFGEMIPIALKNGEDFTGGTLGVVAITKPEIFGYALVKPLQMYYLLLAVVAIVVILMVRLEDSRIGRSWNYIKENELAASVMGIDVTRNKLLAMSISAAMAAVAGSIFAVVQGTVTPMDFHFWESLLVVTMLVLGGLGSIPGALFGAFVLVLLPELLRGADLYRQLLFGLALALIFLTMPKGLLAKVSLKSKPVKELTHSTPQGRQNFGMEIAKLGATEILLETKGITKSFGGVMAVKELDLVVKRGEVVGLIGPNGAGKTTLFNLVTGVYIPTKGSIFMNGLDYTKLKPHVRTKLGIARTFQNISTFGSLSVLENVMAGLYVRTKTGVVGAMVNSKTHRFEELLARQKASDCLQFVDAQIFERRFEQVSSLPYALQKKVEIARALATEPQLLILDEPAAGLNSTEKMELGELIKKIQEAGVSVLLVEHDIKLVSTVSDRIVVLDYGEKIAEGTASEVQNNEKVIEAYLGKEEDDQEYAVGQ